MPAQGRAGALYALLAYTSWGLVPIYWKALASVPAFEILLHRVVGTALFSAVLLTVARRWHEVAAALRRPRQLGALLASALLIATNWLLFIWAVQEGRIVATSLGYYLNPLCNVALGTLLLRERLSRLQLLAVAIAAAGVAWFTIAMGGLPWISLVLGSSFACYGLIRKTVPVGSLAGLAVETALLAPAALAVVAWREAQGSGAVGRLLSAPGGGLELALLAMAGIVTALPLLWFASAARRLRLATVGLFQYLTPSLTLLLAVAVYGEPFTRAHAVTFACIWTALALYSAESVRVLRALPVLAAPTGARPRRSADP